jgi:hypothetical protein
MKVCRPLISSKKGNVVYIMTQAEKRSICEQLVDSVLSTKDADLILYTLGRCISHGCGEVVCQLQRR